MKIHSANFATMTTPVYPNSRPMNKFNLLRCIGLTLLTACPSFADTTLGTGINALDPKSNAPVNYQLENSINCPVATFGTGVFAGNGNQWGNNDFAPFNSYNAGGVNVGGLAGISIPLGGSLAQYCRKQAEMQIERAKLLSINERRNAAVSFLALCEWIRLYYPRYRELLVSSTMEKNKNPFELFAECPGPEVRIVSYPETRNSEENKTGKNKEKPKINKPDTIEETKKQITPPPIWQPQSPFLNPIPVQANPR
jgi:hypothetical protein